MNVQQSRPEEWGGLNAVKRRRHGTRTFTAKCQHHTVIALLLLTLFLLCRHQSNYLST